MFIDYTTGPLIPCNHKFHVSLSSTYPYILFLILIFLYYSLTLHMMSTNYPLFFIVAFLSSVISSWKYAPGTSNMATSRPSIVSIMSVVVSASVDTVGDDMVSPSFINRFCLIPSAYVIPFILPLLSCLIKLTASSAPHLFLFVRPSGLMVPKMGSLEFIYRWSV